MVPLKPSTIHHKKYRAFTLLEVLVALTVIAITLGAIIKTSADQAANTSYLKQKTIANWVALNIHNQLLLEKKWPDIGKSTDSTRMAKHDWHWQREVLKTLSNDTRKVVYRVYADDELRQPVSSLTGYVTHPKFLN